MRPSTLIHAPLVIVALVLASVPAQAAVNLIVNGDFTQFADPSGATPNTSYQLAKTGSSQAGATLTGWGNTGYGFIYTPGSADTTGAVTPEFGNGITKLWGPGGGTGAANYSNNGLTATSPTGGNFIVEDGAYEPGYLYQTITGLTVGTNYSLSFYWAAAQEASSNYTSPTTENYTVYWADANSNVTSTYVTPTVNTPGEGFSPWRQQVVTFAATTTTETVAFLAAGTPSGQPPYSLLDGVSLVAAPEPTTWALLLAGLIGLPLLRRGATRLKVASSS